MVQQLREKIIMFSICPSFPRSHLALSLCFLALPVMLLAFSADMIHSNHTQTHTLTTYMHKSNIDSCSGCLALWLSRGIVLCTRPVVGYRVKAYNLSLFVSNELRIHPHTIHTTVRKLKKYPVTNEKVQRKCSTGDSSLLTLELVVWKKSPN